MDEAPTLALDLLLHEGRDETILPETRTVRKPRSTSIATFPAAARASGRKNAMATLADSMMLRSQRIDQANESEIEIVIVTGRGTETETETGIGTGIENGIGIGIGIETGIGTTAIGLASETGTETRIGIETEKGMADASEIVTGTAVGSVTASTSDLDIARRAETETANGSANAIIERSRAESGREGTIVLGQSGLANDNMTMMIAGARGSAGGPHTPTSETGGGATRHLQDATGADRKRCTECDVTIRQCNASAKLSSGKASEKIHARLLYFSPKHFQTLLSTCSNNSRQHRLNPRSLRLQSITTEQRSPVLYNKSVL